MKFLDKAQFKSYIPRKIEKLKAKIKQKNYIYRIKNFFKFGLHDLGLHYIPKEYFIEEYKDVMSVTCVTCGRLVDIRRQGEYKLPLIYKLLKKQNEKRN